MTEKKRFKINLCHHRRQIKPIKINHSINSIILSIFSHHYHETWTNYLLSVALTAPASQLLNRTSTTKIIRIIFQIINCIQTISSIALIGNFLIPVAEQRRQWQPHRDDRLSCAFEAPIWRIFWPYAIELRWSAALQRQLWMVEQTRRDGPRIFFFARWHVLQALHNTRIPSYFELQMVFMLNFPD